MAVRWVQDSRNDDLRPTTIADMSDMSPEHSESRSTGWIVAWIARAITYLLYAYVLIVEVILVVGFLLKLFGASRASGFVDWWYRHLEDVMEPFRGIFPTKDVGESGSIIDFAVLFAIIVYGILAMLAHALVQWIDTKVVHLRAAADAAAKEAQAAADVTGWGATPTPPGAAVPPPAAGGPAAPGTGVPRAPGSP